MDTVKIKNRVADWLTFEPRQNLDLSSPVFDRMIGKLTDLIKIKKKLFKNVNYVFEHLKKNGVTIEFKENKKVNNYWNFHEIVYSFSGKSEKSIKILNKLYDVSSAKSFNINSPNIDPKSFELVMEIYEKYKYMSQYPFDIKGATVIFSKPIVYFDYFSNNFKIKFNILDLILPAKTLENIKRLKDIDDRIYFWTAVSKKGICENDGKLESNEVKSGFDDIKGLSYDHFEVKNQSKLPKKFESETETHCISIFGEVNNYQNNSTSTESESIENDEIFKVQLPLDSDSSYI